MGLEEGDPVVLESVSGTTQAMLFCERAFAQTQLS